MEKQVLIWRDRRDACADMVATIQITQCQLRQDSRYENALRVVLQQVAMKTHNHLATSAYVITSSRSGVVINNVSYAHINSKGHQPNHRQRQPQVSHCRRNPKHINEYGYECITSCIAARKSDMREPHCAMPHIL